MATWVVELTGHDIAGAADKTRLFSLGRGIAFSDHAPAKAGLLRWLSPSQRIDISAAGVVQTHADAGEIVIANVAADIAEAGPLDDLATWAWQGRTASLYWVPARLWAERVLSATGVLEQPVAGLVVDSGYDGSLRFPLRDPRAALDAPLQPTKYAGDNVPPAGVEGQADLKGKPKPIVYGVVSNWPGVRVNAQKLIYQLADKAAAVLCVRDGGLPLSVSTVRGSLASMVANAPPPGAYDTYAGTEGTFVRLGSTPAFLIAFDVAEGATAADRTHAQIWKRIRLERCGNVSGDLAAAAISAVDSLDGHETGFAWIDETTRRAAIDELLESLSGYEVQNLDGTWSLGRLAAPSGDASLGLVLLGEDSALAATDRPLVSLERARPSYQPNGSPPYQVNVQWGRCRTVMSPADFAGAASQRLKDKFATEWRVESASDTSVWNPATSTGNFPNAPALTISTGYQPGADGLTCPHAATYAAERLALYSALKGQFQASFQPEPGDTILPGAIASVTYPGHGLAGGPKFVVLQSAWLVESVAAKATVILGLQT